MRTIVDLPDPQIRALGRWCDRERISRAEAVRQAIGEFLARRRTQTGRIEGFGAWKGRSIDGLQFQRQARGEWDGRDRRIGHQHRR